VSVALLDVNVLAALFDPAHVHHEPAHRWFAQHRKHGWATCPQTLNGCVRVLSNPVYPTVRASPADVIEHLQTFCSDSHHIFWPDTVSLLDETLIQKHALTSHRAVTDVHLLALAVKHHGRLVTFDGAIPIRAVHGAASRHLTILS
jgi:toxin-antitoxin system PIN domain toxin